MEEMFQDQSAVPVGRRALIVEDNPDDARHVAEALAAIGFVCDVIDEGKTGCRKAASGDYDIAIVDNRLPNLKGTAIVARLRSFGSRLPIMMMSSLGDGHHAVDGLTCGADDYVRKPCSIGEIQARVEALLRRSGGDARRKAEPPLLYDDIVVEPSVRRASRNGRILSLTPMEYSLLEFLVRNRGRLMRAQAIVEQVWGFDAGTSQNLMATRLSQLRRKIVRPGERDPIVTRRGFGYGIL